jgi:hypothetical protein
MLLGVTKEFGDKYWGLIFLGSIPFAIPVCIILFVFGAIWKALEWTNS